MTLCFKLEDSLETALFALLSKALFSSVTTNVNDDRDVFRSLFRKLGLRRLLQCTVCAVTMFFCEKQYNNQTTIWQLLCVCMHKNLKENNVIYLCLSLRSNPTRSQRLIRRYETVKSNRRDKSGSVARRD
jgi:hypothetical protein